MTERDCVHFGDTTIEYEVRRSARRRKTVQVTVAGGGVEVAASMTTPDGELRAIVRKRALWILNRASGEMLEAAPKRFVSGETLPYLDRNVRMIVESADVAVAGGPIRSLATPGLRAAEPGWRGTLRVDSPGCRRVVPCSRRRAASGRRRPLVAQARPGREVADTRP